MKISVILTLFSFLGVVILIDTQSSASRWSIENEKLKSDPLFRKSLHVTEDEKDIRKKTEVFYLTCKRDENTKSIRCRPATKQKNTKRSKKTRKRVTTTFTRNKIKKALLAKKKKKKREKDIKMKSTSNIKNEVSRTISKLRENLPFVIELEKNTEKLLRFTHTNASYEGNKILKDIREYSDALPSYLKLMEYQKVEFTSRTNNKTNKKNSSSVKTEQVSFSGTMQVRNQTRIVPIVEVDSPTVSYEASPENKTEEWSSNKYNQTDDAERFAVKTGSNYKAVTNVPMSIELIKERLKNKKEKYEKTKNIDLDSDLKLDSSTVPCETKPVPGTPFDIQTIMQRLKLKRKEYDYNKKYKKCLQTQSGLNLGITYQEVPWVNISTYSENKPQLTLKHKKHKRKVKTHSSIISVYSGPALTATPSLKSIPLFVSSQQPMTTPSKQSMTRTLTLIEEDYISTNQPSLMMTSSNIHSVSSLTRNASSELNKVIIDVFDGNEETHPSQSTDYKSQHVTATNTIDTQQSSAYNVFITIALGSEIKATERETSSVFLINQNKSLFHSSNASEISSQNDSMSKNHEIANTTSNATSPMYMDLIFDDVYNENNNDSKFEIKEGMNKTQNKVEDLKAKNITQEILDDLLQKSSDVVSADSNVTSTSIDTGVNKTLMDELVETFNNHFEGVTPTLLSPASITQTEVFSTTQPNTKAQPIIRGKNFLVSIGLLNYTTGSSLKNRTTKNQIEHALADVYKKDKSFISSKVVSLRLAKGQNATVVDIELYFTEHSKSHLQSLQDQLGKGFIDMFPVTKHLIDISLLNDHITDITWCLPPCFKPYQCFPNCDETCCKTPPSSKPANTEYFKGSTVPNNVNQPYRVNPFYTVYNYIFTPNDALKTGQIPMNNQYDISKMTSHMDPETGVVTCSQYCRYLCLPFCLTQCCVKVS